MQPEGSGSEFFNFKTPSVNLERMKVESSNLVYRYSITSHSPCTIKYPKVAWSESGAAEFFNFGTPP